MNRRDLFKTAAALPFAANAATPAAWKPDVFDDHQNQTVMALIDLVIPQTDTPGAKAALANRYIDLFLRDGDSSERERFLSGIAMLDARAINTYRHPFITCTAAQQTELLTTLDQAAAPFFRHAKAVTSRLYYSTEPGFRELNKGGRLPSTFGCTHTNHG